MTLNYEILADISEEWEKNLEEENTVFCLCVVKTRQPRDCDFVSS